MKKIDYKKLMVTVIVCLFPIILGLIFYNELPDKIAIHFDINNNPDNYFSKPLFVFGMPIMMLILQSIMCITNDIKDNYKEVNKKATDVYKWILPVLSVILYIVTIMYSLGSVIDIRKILMLILGILFVTIGNYLPKTKGNNFIRPYKNYNSAYYKKFSRIMGYLYIINGILCIVSILFNQIVSAVLVILIILESIVTGIYFSYKDR